MNPEVEQKQPAKFGLKWLLLLGPIVGTVMAVLTIFGVDLFGVSVGRTSEPPPAFVEVGSPAPDFEASLVDGSLIGLSDYQGKAVALNFWATWCAPCLVEMPLLEEASQSYADAGFVVLGVNYGEAQPRVEQFIEEQGLTFPIVLDPNEDIVQLYGVINLPTTFWIDPEGNVETMHLGIVTEAQLDGYLTSLLP